MIKTTIWVVILLLACYSGYAQCEDATYELAVAKAGKDIVLVRDFKVKLREGNKRNPSPSSRFSVLMQKGLTYRFTISKDNTSAIDPILQLFDRGELLASTFEPKTNKNMERFEFKCQRTGNYQVLISMREAKASCAIGLMAMVTDSAFYAQGNSKPENDNYILYVGIENPLNIVTDQKEVKKTVITVNRGEIIQKESAWYVLVPTEGPVKIKVKLYNNVDSVVEEVDQEFKVIALPKPEISIEGSDKEYINTLFLGNLIKLLVKPSVYRIQEFYLSTDLSYNTGLRSNTDYLTNEMVSFIKSLAPQQKFYIKDIQLISPDGNITSVGPVWYYVR
jgi:hypothetical protein